MPFRYPADEAAIPTYLRASDYVEQAGSTLVNLPFPLEMQQLLRCATRRFSSSGRNLYSSLFLQTESLFLLHHNTHLGNILTEKWEVWNRRYQINLSIETWHKRFVCKLAGPRLSQNYLLSRLTAWLRRVLDLGCGTGVLFEDFEARGLQPGGGCG